MPLLLIIVVVLILTGALGGLGYMQGGPQWGLGGGVGTLVVVLVVLWLLGVLR